MTDDDDGLGLVFDFGFDLDAMGFDSEGLLYKQVQALATDVADLPPVDRNRFLGELYQAERQARRRRTLSGRRPPRRHRTTLT